MATEQDGYERLQKALQESLGQIKDVADQVSGKKDGIFGTLARQSQALEITRFVPRRKWWGKLFKNESALNSRCTISKMADGSIRIDFEDAADIDAWYNSIKRT